ncbi:unnamed protein product [Trichogramma brassicae]|uniref:DUF243 domain-containing protein n=1 Tax=Trichogramma brassicae TaxID=86971 RepID=A0A6H5I206_9HYME|nr:unnamed protein product [Trichogramma brassicae]
MCLTFLFFSLSHQILCVASVALARPDIGLKLRQQALLQAQAQHGQVDSYGQPLGTPAQQYGPPAKVYGPPSNVYIPAQQQQVRESTYYSGPIASQGHALPVQQVREVVSHVPVAQTPAPAPLLPVVPAANFNSGYEYNAPSHNVQNNQAGSHSSGSSHSGYHYGNGHQEASQEAVVHKHVYVHLPPPEADEHLAPTVIRTAPAQPQKHYKIVFIKAPTVQQPAPIVHAPAVQNEEKTLIYVLVKKPEEQQEVVIPAAQPATPTKPEVFFIKYKAQVSKNLKTYSLAFKMPKKKN